MRTRRVALLVALVAGFGSSGAALAQAGGATGEIEASTELSPKEKINYASDAIIEIKAASKDVAKLLADTEKGEADPLTIQCLNAKLGAIRSLIEVAESSNATMQEALAEGNDELADHEFRKIAVALSKSREFRAEAEACAGAGEDAGDTTVKVEGDPYGSGDDTEGIDDGNTDIGDDTPPITPFE